MPWHWQERGEHEIQQKEEKLKKRIPYQVWLKQKATLEKKKTCIFNDDEVKSSTHDPKPFQRWLEKKNRQKVGKEKPISKVVSKPSLIPQRKVRRKQAVSTKPSKPDDEVEKSKKREKMYSEWILRKNAEKKQLLLMEQEARKTREEEKKRERQEKWKKKAVVMSYSQAV